MNAICPFCDHPVMYGGVEFGASFLHDECYAKLQAEMADDPVVLEFTPLEEHDQNVERGQDVA